MWVLGLDGGGTKTEAVLCDGRDAVGRGRGGPSNPHFVPGAAAEAALAVAMEGALASTGADPARVEWVVFGGPVSTDVLARVAHRLLPGAALRRCHEGDLALAAGGVRGPGLAVVSGTGSLVMARNAGGRRAIVGGWGSVMGDEGSGGDIGRQALVAAARAADGRGPATQLTTLICAWAGAATLREAVAHVYGPSTARHDIAGLAALVDEADRAGDGVASSILDGAGSELALQVAAALEQAGDMGQPPWPLVAVGGVLAGSRRVRQSLLAHLRSYPVGLVVPVRTMAEAAARWPRDGLESAEPGAGATS